MPRDETAKPKEPGEAQPAQGATGQPSEPTAGQTAFPARTPYDYPLTRDMAEAGFRAQHKLEEIEGDELRSDEEVAEDEAAIAHLPEDERRLIHMQQRLDSLEHREFLEDSEQHEVDRLRYDLGLGPDPSIPMGGEPKTTSTALTGSVLTYSPPEIGKSPDVRTDSGEKKSKLKAAIAAAAVVFLLGSMGIYVLQSGGGDVQVNQPPTDANPAINVNANPPPPPPPPAADWRTQIAPVNASFDAPAQTTYYVADDAPGVRLTYTWSGPTCGNTSGLGPSDGASLVWIHPHPPCDPTTGHATTTVRVRISDGTRAIDCPYQGAASGTGQTCVPVP